MGEKMNINKLSKALFLINYINDGGVIYLCKSHDEVYLYDKGSLDLTDTFDNILLYAFEFELK